MMDIVLEQLQLMSMLKGHKSRLDMLFEDHVRS